MKDRKILSMDANIALGLSWLFLPFGIVCLAVDHANIVKEDKQQIVSSFVLEGISYILWIVIVIIDTILSTATEFYWFDLFGLVLLVPAIFAIIAMIQCFRGVEYHCPLAWQIAGNFVHEGPADKKTAEEAKAEEADEEEAPAEEAPQEEEKTEE